MLFSASLLRKGVLTRFGHYKYCVSKAEIDQLSGKLLLCV